MSDVRVHGTSDPADIAAVLAVIARRAGTTEPQGLAAWTAGRRAALVRYPRGRDASTD